MSEYTYEYSYESEPEAEPEVAPEPVPAPEPEVATEPEPDACIEKPKKRKPKTKKQMEAFYANCHKKGKAALMKRNQKKKERAQLKKKINAKKEAEKILKEQKTKKNTQTEFSSIDDEIEYLRREASQPIDVPVFHQPSILPIIVPQHTPAPASVPEPQRKLTYEEYYAALFP